MRRAAVIGAGIGGLASAIRLRAKGYVVEVFEKEDTPGGKLSELRRDGFRFDLGPSLFTQPERVEELFSLMGERCADSFRYRRLENICRYFWPDGSRLDVPSDLTGLLTGIRQLSARDEGNLATYLEKARILYTLAAPLFIDRPFPTLEAMMSKEGKAIGKNPGVLDPFVSLHTRNRKSFIDPRLVQLFDRYATYNGSKPYKAPATLKMIAHLEHDMGAFFPEEGMYSITSSLARLAERHGVVFHFGHAVEEVERAGNGRKIEGIRVNGRDIPFDLVVSNIDTGYFYRKGIAGIPSPLAGRFQEPSSSALIIYWGVEGAYPVFDLHNILFSGDYRNEFRHLFKLKEPYHDPTVYLFISSRVVETDAPAGHENWFVMVNAPRNTGQDWDAWIPEIRRIITDKIMNMTGIDIREKIVAEHVEDPRTIESRTGSLYGSLYGNSSNSRLSAFSRHPNHRRRIRNLYFTGGSVHPGGGIPLCLASARIVADMIEPAVAEGNPVDAPVAATGTKAETGADGHQGGTAGIQ